MTAVVLASHRGICCAWPARQVIGLASGETAEAPLELWPATTEPEAPRPRVVRVRTAQGPRSVSCEWVKYGDLASQRLQPLSPLLAREIGLPHVVGLAEIDGGFIWLVDLEVG